MGLAPLFVRFLAPLPMVCRVCEWVSVGQAFVATRMLSSVSQDEHNRVASEEHLGDEPVLVDRLLALALGDLCPHLLDVFEDHVGMAIEGLDAGEELLVVAEGDKDLGMVTHGLLEDGEGALRDFVLFQLADLGLVQLGLGDIDVLAVYMGKHDK